MVDKMAKTMNEQQKALNSIKTGLATLTKSISTQQQKAQELMTMAVWYSFKYSDSDAIKLVVDGLTEVKGSFRIESVVYWLEVVAGFDLEHDKSTGRWSVRRTDREFGTVKIGEVEKQVKYTYDSTHLNICKLPHLFFWKIAPVEIKKLKLPEDLAKVFDGVEVQLARALAAQKFTTDQIKAQLELVLAGIIKQASSKKTAEWLIKYKEQQSVTNELNESKLVVPEEQE
jgi:hypothetical protein